MVILLLHSTIDSKIVLQIIGKGKRRRFSRIYNGGFTGEAGRARTEDPRIIYPVRNLFGKKQNELVSVESANEIPQHLK